MNRTFAEPRPGAEQRRDAAFVEQVIEALDKVLIPNAQNAERKGLLVAMRPAFAAHLDHARSLQSALAK